MSETELTPEVITESEIEILEVTELTPEVIPELTPEVPEVPELTPELIHEVITPGPEPGHLSKKEPKPVQEPEREFDFKFFLNKAYDRIEELENKLEKMEGKPRGCFSFLKNKK